MFFIIPITAWFRVCYDAITLTDNGLWFYTLPAVSCGVMLIMMELTTFWLQSDYSSGNCKIHSSSFQSTFPNHLPSLYIHIGMAMPLQFYIYATSKPIDTINKCPACYHQSSKFHHISSVNQSKHNPHLHVRILYTLLLVLCLPCRFIKFITSRCSMTSSAEGIIIKIAWRQLTLMSFQTSVPAVFNHRY